MEEEGKVREEKKNAENLIGSDDDENLVNAGHDQSEVYSNGKV